MATHPVDIQLHDTIDPKVWAKEWCRVVAKHPELASDEQFMCGWFANSIMVGYDHGYRRCLEGVENSIEKSARKFVTDLEQEFRDRRHPLRRKLRALRGLPPRPSGATLAVAQPGDEIEKQP